MLAVHHDSDIELQALHLVRPIEWIILACGDGLGDPPRKRTDSPRQLQKFKVLIENEWAAI